MSNIAIVDDSFDIYISSSYHLSLQISSSGLTFAVMDTVRMKFIAFKSILFDKVLEGKELFQKLDVLFNTEGYLKRNYRYLSLYYVSSRASLIPGPLYDRTEKVLFDKFLGQSENEQVHLEKYIQELDAYLFFSLPETIYNMSLNQLDSPKFFHQAIPMIENALVAGKGKSGNNRVYAQIHPDFMDVIVIQDGKLLLYNSFPYKNEKDMEFYILYLYDQFQLPTQQTTLELSGLTNERSEFFILLKNYIRVIVFQEFNRSFSYSYTFNELPQHHFSNLINLFRCE